MKEIRDKYYLSFDPKLTKDEARKMLNIMIDFKVGGTDCCSRYGDYEATRTFLVGVINA